MTIEIIIGVVLFILACIWWAWFARKLDGIHKETHRTAHYLEAMNMREMRRETAERQAQSIAEAVPVPNASIESESARIAKETRRRAGF